jgi:hypothetical protein
MPYYIEGCYRPGCMHRGMLPKGASLQRGCEACARNIMHYTKKATWIPTVYATSEIQIRMLYNIERVPSPRMQPQQVPVGKPKRLRLQLGRKACLFNLKHNTSSTTLQVLYCKGATAQDVVLYCKGVPPPRMQPQSCREVRSPQSCREACRRKHPQYQHHVCDPQRLHAYSMFSEVVVWSKASNCRG